MRNEHREAISTTRKATEGVQQVGERPNSSQTPSARGSKFRARRIGCTIIVVR